MVYIIILTPIYHKLPYDKAALPVKRIDAFQFLFQGAARYQPGGSDHGPGSRSSSEIKD